MSSLPGVALTTQNSGAEGTPIKRRRLHNLTFDHQVLSANTAVSFSDYSGCGFLETDLNKRIFRHCSFTNCYLRSATLDECQFWHCTFTDCNFTGASFFGSRLDYSEFRNCSVTYSQLRDCMPLHQLNVRHDLAQNLKMNATNRGESEDARSFLLVELDASERFNWRKGWPPADSWESTKYSKPEDRWAGKRDWFWLWLNRWFWGYGEEPQRLVYIGVLALIVFAIVFYLPGLTVSALTSSLGFTDVLDHLGFSAASLASIPYGTEAPANLAGRVAVTVEGLLGLVLFGFFISALYRRISRR